MKGAREGVRMKQLPKPKFGTWSGYWVNPMILPESLRLTLARECVRGRLSAKQAEAALLIAGEEAQMVLESRKTRVPTATIQSELEAVAVKARALLQAMRTLQDGTVMAFSAHWDYLAYGTTPPIELSDIGKGLRGREARFLGGVWDVVQDLESSARYAADKCQPSKQAQVSRELARALARRVAERLRMLTGRLPPYSKDTWFPDFMAELCAWPELSLPCGRALVESAVRSIDHPF